MDESSAGHQKRPERGGRREEAEGEILAMVIDCEGNFEKGLASAGKAGNEESVAMLRRLKERFLDWAAYLGVFAHARGSLDHRVETLPQYRNLILLVLDVINQNLIQSAGISGEFDSDESSDDETDHAEINVIQKAINELDRIAFHLRQATTSSIDARVEAFASKRAIEVSSFEAKAIFALNALYPDAPERICRLLSKSMTHRHTKLLYWKSHDDKLRDRRRKIICQDKASHGEKKPPRTKAHDSSPPPLGRDGDPPLRMPEESRISLGPSRLSETVASEHDIRHYDYGTEEERPDRKRAGASTVFQTRARFPSPPRFDKNDGERQKSCPFCRKWFDKEDLTTTLWWRSHVNNDLLPFVCVLSSCSDHSSFASRSEWADHIAKEHAETVPHNDGFCVLCCMPIEDERDRQTAAPQAGESSNSRFSSELLVTSQVDIQTPSQMLQIGQKTPRFELPESKSNQKEHPVNRNEAEKVARPTDRRLDSSSRLRRKHDLDHIAGHLQFLALLTLRLSASNLEEGNANSFSSSQAPSSEQSSGARSTMAGLSEVSEKEEMIEEIETRRHDLMSKSHSTWSAHRSNDRPSMENRTRPDLQPRDIFNLIGIPDPRLRFQIDQVTLWKLLSEESQLQADKSTSPISLAQFLDGEPQPLLTEKTKSILCVLISYAVFHLFDTTQMNLFWGSENIKFYGTNKSLSLRPYVDTLIEQEIYENSTRLAQNNDDEELDPDNPFLPPCPCLIYLATVMIEIHHRKSLTSIGKVYDIPVSADMNLAAQFISVRKIFRATNHTVVDRVRMAIAACLDPYIGLDEVGERIGGDKMRDVLYERVIRRLEDELVSGWLGFSSLEDLVARL